MPLNFVRVRPLPPTRTIVRSAGDGSSSGVIPLSSTTRPDGRAASAQRRRIAVASASGQSPSMLFRSRDRRRRAVDRKKLCPERVTRSVIPSNVAAARARVRGRSTSVPRNVGRARSTSASSAPVPPPTSTTVRICFQSVVSSRTSGSGRPWLVAPSGHRSRRRFWDGRRDLPKRAGRRLRDRLVCLCERRRAGFPTPAPSGRRSFRDRTPDEIESIPGGIIDRELPGLRLPENALFGQMPEHTMEGFPIGSGDGS
jgi:hypothetical protein